MLRNFLTIVYNPNHRTHFNKNDINFSRNPKSLLVNIDTIISYYYSFTSLIGHCITFTNYEHLNRIYQIWQSSQTKRYNNDILTLISILNSSFPPIYCPLQAFTLKLPLKHQSFTLWQINQFTLQDHNFSNFATIIDNNC